MYLREKGIKRNVTYDSVKRSFEFRELSEIKKMQ